MCCRLKLRERVSRESGDLVRGGGPRWLTLRSSHSFEQSLFLPFWRSKVSVNLMVEKADKR